MSSPRRRHRRVDAVLHLAGLEEVADRPAGRYSGGMRRRLGLAQALLNDPAVLLLDEPTAGLDPQEQTRVRMLLASLAGQRTVVLATRDAADVSSTCRRCAVLAGGRMIFQGEAAGLARAADGLVWSVQTDRPLSALQAATVASAVRLPDRTVYRVISPAPPLPSAQPLRPGLEDGYLALIRRHPAARPGAARLVIMHTLVVDHPLIAHKLTTLRDERTDSPTFRRLTDELVTLLAYEATREVRVQPEVVTTPVAEARGVKLARPVPLVVPVLRAGIGMLDGMIRLLPQADVGFVGLARDEESLVAATYANRLPANLAGRDVFVLDPMLATGGTLETVITMLSQRDAASVTAVCLLAAPEGIERIKAAFPSDNEPLPVRVVTAALDERLNERGYIVPGLGDAGDRLFGEI